MASVISQAFPLLLQLFINWKTCFARLGITTEYINSLTSSMHLFLMKMHPIKHKYIYTESLENCDTQVRMFVYSA